MAQFCPHCKNVRGWWGGLPCWIFTRAPRIFAMSLHWQHQLLLICTHATLFRHRAHIRLWFHSQNKWASLRRYKLTGEAVVKMGFMEIWNSHWSLHTPSGFSQDRFSTNQLLWCHISASFSIWQVTNCLIWSCLIWLRDMFIIGSWKSKGDVRVVI